MQQRQELSRLLWRKIDRYHPVNARGSSLLGKIGVAHHLDGIQIAHQHHRGGVILFAELLHHLQHLPQGDVVRQCPFVGKLDRRAIRHGIRKGHSQLDQIRPGLCHGMHQRNGDSGFRITGGNERDKGLAPRCF